MTGLAPEQRARLEIDRQLEASGWQVQDYRQEVAIDRSLLRAARLRQSILKRAFAGQLVPQDPRDEPASVLLERVTKLRLAGVPKSCAAEAPTS